jgi:hypothetical protein
VTRHDVEIIETPEKVAPIILTPPELNPIEDVPFNWKSKESYFHFFQNTLHKIENWFTHALEFIEAYFKMATTSLPSLPTIPSLPKLKMLEIFETRKPRKSRLDEFIYGLSSSLFKIEPRLSVTCFNSGSLLFNSFWKVFVTFIKSGSITS